MRIADIEVVNLHFSYPKGNGFRYAGGTVTSRVSSIVLVTTDDGTTGMGAVYSHPAVDLPADSGEARRLFQGAGWFNVGLALEPGALDLETWLAGAEGRHALAGSLGAWIGNEFEGLDPADRSVCDRALVVPMAEGHDSLNAAVAAGIAFYRLK